jgi:alpha-L-fucosidase
VCQNETSSSVFYTKKGSSLYAHFTKWPSENSLLLDCPVPTPDTEIHFLGLERQDGLDWNPKSANTIGRLSGIDVMLPSLTPDKIPCNHAWVLKISGIANIG